jgi:hypothetical protein
MSSSLYPNQMLLPSSFPPNLYFLINKEMKYFRLIRHNICWAMVYNRNTLLMNNCIKHQSKWVQSWFCESGKYNHISVRKRTDRCMCKHVCECGKTVKDIRRDIRGEFQWVWADLVPASKHKVPQTCTTPVQNCSYGHFVHCVQAKYQNIKCINF